MSRKKNKSFDFFLTDNSGNLYKATAFDEKDFDLDEDEEKEEMKEVVEEKETKDEELVLTPEEVAFIKELFAKHKAEKEEEMREEPEEVKEELKEEEVIDTCKSNDSAKAIGSLEPQIKTNDSANYDYQDEIVNAWKSRIKKEN